MRLLLNAVYALMAERADAVDRAQLAILANVDKRDREGLCQNRERLEAWLAAPFGAQALAEKALIRELLGGAA